MIAELLDLSLWELSQHLLIWEHKLVLAP